jgi:hypothetical protein
MFFIGLCAAWLWKDREIQQERRANTSYSEGLGTELLSLKASVKDLTEERDEAKATAAKLEEALSAIKTQQTRGESNAPSSPLKQPTEQGEGGAKNLGKMLTDLMKAPGMKDVMKQQMQAQIDMMYGGLISRLHLNSDEKQDLKNMLTERLQAQSDFGLRLVEEGLSEDQRNAALKSLKEAQGASDLKIKTFLNNDQDYQIFQTWEGTQAERMALNMGHSAFSEIGEPLTSEQEDQLVKAMAFARTQNTAVPDLSKVENLAKFSGDETAIAKMTVALKDQAQQVAAAAASFLSPKQLEALKTVLEQRQNMEAAGLKMGASMFKKKN